MAYQPNIKTIDAQKQLIFCDWRHKFVALTPEEWVRQTFLHSMVDSLSYPMRRIGVEVFIKMGDLCKRCDAIVYDAFLQPLCLIEFKAPSVPLTQKVFDQAAVYNRRLHVSCFIISNGENTYACRVSDAGYTFLSAIPSYKDLRAPVAL